MLTAPIVFVHGGVPGATPYISGPHIWGTLERFESKVIVLALQATEVDGMLAEVREAITSLERCHLVGHDLGGLVALLAGAEAPQRVKTVSAVASVAAAPTGDGVENLTFAHPPVPRWSRESQRWALERVSYSHHHIDEALLDACVRAALQAPLGEDERFAPSLAAAKGRFYALCREQGYPVPAQVIWGTHDPLGSLEQGLALFRVLAAKQKAAQFHAVNRAGSLLFREEPEAFHQVVSAFADAA